MATGFGDARVLRARRRGDKRDLASSRGKHAVTASWQNDHDIVSKKKKKKAKPEDLLTIPMEDLVLSHSEIGVHRGRQYGFRDVFGFRTLRDQPFTKLAKKVKAAYLGEDVPKHKGWPAQREALKWLVDKGADAMYQFKDDIRVMRDHDDTYYIVGGNHRALALYILGADSVHAVEE